MQVSLEARRLQSETSGTVGSASWMGTASGGTEDRL